MLVLVVGGVVERVAGGAGAVGGVLEDDFGHGGCVGVGECVGGVVGVLGWI